MKSKIFMYLFIFSILLLLFQYVNSKNILDKYEADISELKEHSKAYKDSVSILQNKVDDLLYFSLENNEDAYTYFEKDGLDVTTLIPFIKDEMYTLNEGKGENPLIPYAAADEERKLIINNIKLLNHKWIIADFSDGIFWGELFITYEITKEKELKFRLVESFLYPLQ